LPFLVLSWGCHSYPPIRSKGIGSWGAFPAVGTGPPPTFFRAPLAFLESCSGRFSDRNRVEYFFFPTPLRVFVVTRLLVGCTPWFRSCSSEILVFQFFPRPSYFLSLTTPVLFQSLLAVQCAAPDLRVASLELFSRQRFFLAVLEVHPFYAGFVFWRFFSSVSAFHKVRRRTPKHGPPVPKLPSVFSTLNRGDLFHLQGAYLIFHPLGAAASGIRRSFWARFRPTRWFPSSNY